VSLWCVARHRSAFTLAARTILFLVCIGVGFQSPIALAQAANAVPQTSITPIGLSNPANGLSAQDPVRQASEALIQWRRDWENRDFERFSAHYSEVFQSAGVDRPTYLARKRVIFERRPWQRIRINEVLWFSEQGSPDALTVRFIQEYDSPQGSDRSRKEQRWVRANQRWLLAGETEAIFAETDAGRARTKSVTGSIGK